MKVLLLAIMFFLAIPALGDDSKQAKEIVSVRAPKILAPEHLAIIQTEVDRHPLLIQWTGSMTASQFVVNISIDKSFNQLVHVQKTKKLSIKKTLQPGTYYIRVAKLEDDGEQVWSKSIKIALNKRQDWSRSGSFALAYRGTQQSVGLKTDQFAGDLVVPMTLGASMTAAQELTDWLELGVRATYSSGVVTKEQLGVTNKSQENLNATQMSGAFLIRPIFLPKSNTRRFALFADLGARYNSSYVLVNESPGLDIVRSLIKSEPLTAYFGQFGIGMNFSFNKDSEGEIKLIFERAMKYSSKLAPATNGGMACLDYYLMLTPLFYLNAAYEFEMLSMTFSDPSISGSVQTTEHSIKLGAGLWW